MTNSTELLPFLFANQKTVLKNFFETAATAKD